LAVGFCPKNNGFARVWGLLSITDDVYAYGTGQDRTGRSDDRVDRWWCCDAYSESATQHVLTQHCSTHRSTSTQPIPTHSLSSYTSASLLGYYLFNPYNSAFSSVLKPTRLAISCPKSITHVSP